VLHLIVGTNIQEGRQLHIHVRAPPALKTRKLRRNAQTRVPKSGLKEKTDDALSSLPVPVMDAEGRLILERIEYRNSTGEKPE
jgi:hypothetical protein